MARDSKPVLLAAAALVALCFGLYAGTFDAPFVFDDTPSIEENPFIEALWPLSRSFGAPPGAGSSGRPLVSFSLALNYALGGREVLGYHLFNVATLALGALALFGLTRRVLLRCELAPHAFGLAFAIALLWVVHPLHTDTLNHVVYRNGSMMAAFYLATLYCAARGEAAEASGRWSLLCVLAAAGAMACKEVAVSLPLAVLAFDRQFGAGSVPAALRRRPGMYAGLAATWALLAWCVLSGDRGESVGFEHAEIIDGEDYLRTQMVALATYARLTWLAGPFVFDYHGQEVVREWANVALEAALFGGLLALSVYGFVRKHPAALLGLLVFAALAPTSSVIPLAGELIGEHRMTLPLAPLVALLVIGAFVLLARLGDAARWLRPAAVVLAGGALAAATVERNIDYESRVALWQDTTQKRPDNERAWNHLALALKNEGRIEEAEVAFLRALAIDPTHAKARFNYGNLLFARGDRGGALREFSEAARRRPQDELMVFNHGYVLTLLGRVPEGLDRYRDALALRPEWDRPKMLLAWALATSPDERVRAPEEAVRLAEALNSESGGGVPRHVDVLAAALAAAGRFPEAERTAARAVVLAQRSGKPQVAATFEARRALYAARQPFREP